MRRAAFVLPIVILLGCTSAASDGAGDPASDGAPAAPLGGSGPGGVTATGNGQAGPAAPPPDADLLEVVHVLIDGERGLCTGTLISKTVVITAAHCLDSKNFGSWDVIAPGAAGKPKSHAARAQMFDDDYEDVAKPDIGAIILEEPIALAAYAELADVSGQVEGDGKVMAATMIRKFIDVDAPLVLLGGLETTSGAKFGYDHGLVTRFFSAGGDSGAGLFLVDKGRRTHQLIGVARQPEPDRNVDHFTRVDAAFIKWVKSLSD